MIGVAIAWLYMIAREDGGLSKSQMSGSYSLLFRFEIEGQYELYGGRLDIESKEDIRAGIGPVRATIAFNSGIAAQALHPGYSFTIRYPPKGVVGFGFIQSMIHHSGDHWVAESCDMKSSQLLCYDYSERAEDDGHAATVSSRFPWHAVESSLPWRGITAQINYTVRAKLCGEHIVDGYGPKHRFEWSDELFLGIHFYEEGVGKDRSVVVKFPPWIDAVSQVKEGDTFEILGRGRVVGHGVVVETLA